MHKYLGKKKVLRIYIDTMDKHQGKPIWEEILKKVKSEGLAGASVFKGVAGIGAFAELRSFNVWAIAQDLPLIIEIIDNEEKIVNFIDCLDEIVDEGLITVSDTQVIRYKHK
jgi:PII-like signaling protein